MSDSQEHLRAGMEASRRGGLWRSRGFLLLAVAYAVSAFGDHLSEIAVLKTQDALRPEVDVTALNARMTFLFFVPFFLFAPGAGWLADRLPRRAVMIAADVARCGIMFSFGSLIAATQSWGTWGPFAPLLVVGAFAALFSPARSALLPMLIAPHQLVRANGMLAGLGIVATMGANLAGGYLARHYDPKVAFRWDAATFLFSAILLSLIRVPRSAAHGGGRATAVGGGMLQGFRYAKCHKRVIQLLVVAGMVWFCGSLVNSVVPAVVRDVYQMDYQAMSGFRAFLGLGFIIGATIMTMLGDALRSEVAITWAFVGISVSILVFAASVFLPLAPGTLFVIGAVGVVGSGVFGVSVMASFDSLLQRIVPNRYRGRVFGVKDVCTTGALLLATGTLAIPQWTRVDRWVGWILVAVSVLTFATAVGSLSIRLRRGTYGKRVAFAENLNEFLAKFWWRMRRVGPAAVPRTGPVIVTANHRCPADPLLLCAAVPYRLISFLIADEYAHFPGVRRLLRLVESIPVKRGARDAEATKAAIRHLRDGKALGIFIEGGIVEPGEVPRPKDGVALLALRTGAAVIPAYISGVSYHPGIVRGLLARHHAQVRFGRAVDLTEFADGERSKEAIQAATRKIYAAVETLAPSAPDLETRP